ncbi:UDP-N-acetylmuramyl pentapeptide phosphotransferase/UDP-N-acetylglucosamine-1-phosphate transferase [Catalinimonas alkaloidigena]|uniref:UDP-N-acetylmuramyl pentapeptide phosphotransferase/UDP-N-acetylglucosamine-1-phosphate transferase n=1 Tax=Catalinimonas alkaloidigena TaxID=1075417 RepID=A0A1G9MNB9_9BACT|nr:MraY family glycosyltransferase [Catalinimonas alkaloidigena]SDL75563.1 UDP-N-acetylmuramyl pentapeptide phosphotransferase/UDP-N-acetylglucosamine-1-phosphate transferase [Catalinimonas alkaloidigena]
MLDLLLAFVWAFMISVFAIPSIVRVAHQKNLLDEPNFRTVHVSLTPRLGGLAIFAGFTSALTIFGEVTPEIQQVLAGCILLFFVGMKDDIVAISPFKKFFIQILATGVVMFMSNIRLTSFQGFLGIYELDPGLSYGITFLAIIGITNAINLIDGLDGLAGTIVTVIATTFGIYFYRYGAGGDQAYAGVAFCLIGGIIGFLRYNLHKAIIFMGDTGSLLCGFLVAVMAVKFVEMKTVPNAPSLAVAILIIPLFDTLRVFATRILRGASPFSPDKNHIHHILIGAGLSQLVTVGLLALINLAVVAAAIYFAPLRNNLLLLGLLVVCLMASGLLEYLRRRRQRKNQLVRR